MILMYTSFGCSSANKAKAFFEEHNLEYVEKNIQSTTLNKDEIKYLLKRCPNGTNDIISKRSKPFKELNQDIDDLSTNALVDFIQENPTVLKRPIILNKQNFVVGYDNDEITSFMPSSMRNIDNLKCKNCANYVSCEECIEKEKKGLN